MNRRAFLRASGTLSGLAIAASTVPGMARPARGQQKEFAPRPGTWREFEITTRVEVARPAGATRVWIPIPAVDAEYQRSGRTTWSGNARRAELVGDPRSGAAMVFAEFAEAERAPLVEAVSRFHSQDRAVDWARKGAAAEAPGVLRRWTEATELMPTDGTVRSTAVDITKGKATDVEKVRALYDWILASTYREPKVRGCGVGDIRTMLKTIIETQNFGGKCADINALFVALARSTGVPARDVYGVRVAPSAFGYKALGAGSATITKAQHCRSEVFLKDYGWVAMDPADVTKVAREETSEWLKIDHPLVQEVRRRLFGGWEGNWAAFNTAHDVTLPNAATPGKIGFLMYPQGETAEGRLDSLDPDTFKYTITAREIRA